MVKSEIFRRRLDEMLNELGKTAMWLSTESGVNKTTISQYRSGCYVPKADSLSRMAQALGVTDEWLAGQNAPKRRSDTDGKENRLPVFDSLPTENDPVRFVACDGRYTPEEHFFILTDDSFYPAVAKGDLALIRKCSSLEYGDVGLIDCGDGAKMYFYKHQGGGGVELSCLNPYTPSLIIEPDAVSSLNIIGKVLYTIRRW